MKLLDYNFKVEWKAGKFHQIPDALSRAPVDDPTEEELSEDAADTLRVGAIVAESAQNVCPNLLVEELQTKAKADPKYQSLVQAGH